MVKAGGGSGTLVTDLEFNKYASNVVGYDPVAKQLYDLGSIDIVMNLQAIAEIGNIVQETLIFEGYPTAFIAPWGMSGLGNSNPQHLVDISSIAYFEDLYPEENVFVLNGNMSAHYYHGDGRYLSNITSNLQTIAELDANTFRTLVLANAITAFEITSNISTSNGVIILGDEEKQIKIGSANYEGNWYSRTIAIGSKAGHFDQQTDSIAIGTGAGEISQNLSAIAIGYNAGSNNQGANTIAIGTMAGTNSQPENSIILNASPEALEAFESNTLHIKPIRHVADLEANVLGYTANNEIVDHTVMTMAPNLVSIDGSLRVSGNIRADGNFVAMGVENLIVDDPIIHLGNANFGVGNDTGIVMEQMDSNIALFYTHQSNEFILAKTLNSAYDTTLTVDSVDHSNLIETFNIYGNVTAFYHIGDGSLLTNVSINIQDASLNGNVTTETILFENAHAAFVIDSNIEANTSITILNRDPTKNSVHIGSESYDAYGAASIGIGRLAGVTSQGEMAIAIGSNAGETEQGANSIAIGSFAGQTSQGGSSIAIGELAATTNQHMNTIVINASNAIALETTNADALYLAPVRDVTNVFSNLLVYSEEHEVIKYSNMCTSNVGDLSVTDNIYAKRLFTDALTIGANIVMDDTFSNVITVTGNIFVSNVIQVGANLFIEEEGMNVLTIIGNAHVSNVVEVGANAVINEFGSNVVFVEGNAHVSNVVTVGSNLTIDEYGSNVVFVSGNLHTTNVVTVGSNLVIDEFGSNVVFVEGNAHVSNVVTVGSNLVIDEYGSNVVYVSGNLHTTNVVTVGSNLIMDEFASNVVFVEGNAHISNLLTIGSNVVLDEFGANVLTISGNAFIDPKLQVGANVMIDDFSANVIEVNGNISANHLFIHALHVGSNVVLDDIAPNVITVTGNVFVSNVIEVGSNLIIENEGTNVLTIVGNAHVSNVVEVGSNIVLDEFGSNAVYVSGNLHTTNVVTVGSNLVIDEFGSNVVYVSGNLHTTNVVTVGSNLVIDEFGSNVVEVSGNLHTTNVVTVGSNLVIDEFGSNVVYVSGNLHTTNVVTVGSNLLIDEFGSNVVEVSGNAHISDLLTIGSNVTIDEFGSNILTISGNAIIDPILQVGSNITMDDLASNALIVNGNIVADRIFLDVLAIGANLTVDDVASNVISVNGNISANYYFGDGGLLSNITIQVASDKGNTTTNTVIFSNTETGLKVDSNVMVEGGVVIVSNQGTGFGNVHIGSDNYHNYGPESIGIGYNAGESNQGAGGIAIGGRTAVSAQGSNAIALGSVAGSVSQGSNAVAVGVEAGLLNQGQDAIAMGFRAGSNFQGTNAVAIGKMAAETSQHTGSIVINSSGNAFGSSNTDALFVKPIRDMTEFQSNLLAYTEEGEIVDFSNIYTSNVGDLSVSGNIYAKRIFTDAINVGANLVIDDVASNVIYVTGNIHTTGDLEAGNNVKAESNIYIGGLSALRYPMVDENNYLIDSNIYEEDGTVIVNTDAEISGNLIVHGTQTTLATETMIVDDVIIGIANNNPSHALDTGIVMEHPGHNVGLIHHGDEDRFTIGYTQNTAADSSIEPDANNIHVDILGNLNVQNDFSVSNLLTVGANVVVGDQMTNIFVINGNVSANYYHGDGRFLSNVQVSIQGASDIGNVTTNTVQFVNNTMAFVTDYTSNVGMNLSQINNVTITDIANGQVLKYSNTTNSWVNEYLDHTYIRVKNVEGAPISAGQVVYAAGATGNETVNVGLADASDPAKMPAIGIALENLATNAEGLAVSFGLVNSLAADFNEGDTLYVSNATPGEVSNVQPHGLTDLIQNIGVLVKGHASQGVAQVTGVGRANDIPNADIVAEKSEINYVYVSNIENDFYKIEVANLLTQTLAEVSNAGNNTSNTVIFSNAETAMLIQQSNLGTDGALTVISTGSGAGNVHLGSESYDAYGAGSVGIGLNAGKTSQSNYSVAVGIDAASNAQGVGGVAIGWNAGTDSQNRRAVAIGQSAGSTSQGESAVAIGRNAGLLEQGSGAVAIGQQAGATSQHENSIVISAGGLTNTGNTYATYINRIRPTTDVTANLMAYTDEREVVDYSNLYVSNLQDLHVVGNVFAWQYYGDGGLLSNVSGELSLDTVSNIGNITSNTIIFSNAETPFEVSGGGTPNFSSQVYIGTSGFLSGIRIGYKAESTISQGIYTIGIGSEAGQSTQGTQAVAIGRSAGRSHQNNNSIAIGANAGASAQGRGSVAIGTSAGTRPQAQWCTAIGEQAGQSYQQTGSVGIGYQAGWKDQNTYSIAIGHQAGRWAQNVYGVAIGAFAGGTSQGAGSIAIGARALTAKSNTIIMSAIGDIYSASNANATYINPIRSSNGHNSTGILTYTSEGEVLNYSNLYVKDGKLFNVGALKIHQDGGNDPGIISLGSETITASNVSFVGVGRNALSLEPADYTVGMGLNAGMSYAAEQAVAIGTNAGRSYAGLRSIAVGHNAGHQGINSYSVAIGYESGQQAMNSYSIALGTSAGTSNQGESAIAIGRSAGNDSQKDHAIAIGRGSGLTDQGNYSVAIGAYAGQTMPDNSIALNATGSALNINSGNSKFFVKPINSSAASAALNWNSSTGEIHTVTSDARTKINRQTIVNGLATVSNLTPQVYDKRAGMEEGDEVYGPESGLVAQDLWYDTPELRHAVILGEGAEPAEEKTPDDYSAWGNVASTIDYDQVIPYLISSIQELKARIIELENNN